MSNDDYSEMTLAVTSCKAIASGTKNGKDWTMFKVEAHGEDGQPLDLEFRSFNPLPLGRRTFDVKSSDRGQYGLQYMLYLPKGETVAPPNPFELQERIERLEEKARLANHSDIA